MMKISGRVVKGKGLGRKLGFPTVNLELQNYRITELQSCVGVFLVKATMDGRNYFGVMHNGKGYVCEIYLFDYDGDAYGKNVSVEVLKKIRDTKRFDNLKDFKKQVSEDVKVAKNICLELNLNLSC